MLSQGHMGAPLYHSIGQVGPRFVGNLGSPMWSENDVSTSWLRLLSALQITSYIRIRHIQSVLAIGMLSQGYMGALLCHYTGQIVLEFRVTCRVNMMP